MHWGQGVTGGGVASPTCGFHVQETTGGALPAETLRARFRGLWLRRHLEQGCLREAEKCSVWNSMLLVHWGLRE